MADDPGVADDKPDEPRGHWQPFGSKQLDDGILLYIATWSADGRRGRDYEVFVPIHVDPETGDLTSVPGVIITCVHVDEEMAA